MMFNKENRKAVRITWIILSLLVIKYDSFVYRPSS